MSNNPYADTTRHAGVAPSATFCTADGRSVVADGSAVLYCTQQPGLQQCSDTPIHAGLVPAATFRRAEGCKAAINGTVLHCTQQLEVYYKPDISMHAGVVPSATFRTAEGRSVVIGGNGDSIYSRLMAAVGRPDLGAHNASYATNTLRCERQDEIYQVTA